MISHRVCGLVYLCYAECNRDKTSDSLGLLLSALPLSHSLSESLNHCCLSQTNQKKLLSVAILQSRLHEINKAKTQQVEYHRLVHEL